MAEKTRNYKKEYAASRTPKRRADNIKRQRDHEAMKKKHGGKIPAGMEVDHKSMLGGSTKKKTPKSSVRLISKTANRKRQPKRK